MYQTNSVKYVGNLGDMNLVSYNQARLYGIEKIVAGNQVDYQWRGK